MAALPCGGLKQPIELRLWIDRGDEDLPNVHTCTHEIHLPAYSSAEVCGQQLRYAMTNCKAMDNDFKGAATAARVHI